MSHDIKIILQAWAVWHCSGNGYPGINPMMLARDGCRVGVPCSRPPRSVEPPEDVAQIMQGMAVFTLAGGAKAAAMAAVKAWYLRGYEDGRKKARDVAEALGIKERTMAEDKKRGEMLLEGWLESWRQRDSA